MTLLDPAALLEQLPQLLPDSSGSEDGGAELLRSPEEALAALTHTILTRIGFRLTSLSDATGSVNVAVQTFPNNRLPPTWNQHGPSSYTFRYAHEQSSLNFLVKIVSLGPRLLIHATALELSRTESYEVEVDRFTSRSFWPWSRPSAEPRAEQEGTQGASLSSSSSREPLVNGFVSSTRIADFVLGAQAKIIQKLVPGLRKEGYEEVAESDQGSGSRAGPSAPPSSRQPPPVRPSVPDDGFPDDYGAAQPPFRIPLAIGDRDLDPLGGPPPLFGGGRGGFPGGDDGGGMIVGPNHPMFRDRFGGGGGGLGGGGMVPPGARFDPVTPFGGPGQGPSPFRPGGGPPPGRGPRRPGMGDPDWDEMPPPGGNVSAAQQRRAM